MPLIDRRRLRERLGEVWGEVPQESPLLEQALTHRSAGSPHNERLEFLGDAVLNLLVAQLLFARFPQASEGELSRLRAKLVSAVPLAEVGAEWKLGDLLNLGSGELRSGGFRRESILADAVEALIAAVYLQSGLEAARRVVERSFAARIEALPHDEFLKDPKTRLQEFLQARATPLPEYSLLATTGADHEQRFQVRCEVRPAGHPQSLNTSGEALSRRGAEQQAAERMLAQLQGDHS